MPPIIIGVAPYKGAWIEKFGYHLRISKKKLDALCGAPASFPISYRFHFSGSAGSTCSFNRPARRTVSRSKNSMWALVLLNSSAAQRSRIAYSLGSSRKGNCFFVAILSTSNVNLLRLFMPFSLIHGSGIDDRLA